MPLRMQCTLTILHEGRRTKKPEQPQSPNANQSGKIIGKLKKKRKDVGFVRVYLRLLRTSATAATTAMMAMDAAAT